MREDNSLSKLRVEQRTKISTIPIEMDEDNGSVLLPCSSSDLERVAGTRLEVAESVMVVTLWGRLRGVV